MTNYNKTTKYFKSLDIDKKNKNKYILINNNHLIHENINVTKIKPSIPNDKDQYGLNLAIFNMICSINICNEHIIESHKLYKKMKDSDDDILFFNQYSYSKYYELNKTIIHSIKYYCDIIITISYLLFNSKKCTNIKVGDIGTYKYLDKNKKIYKNHDNFLNDINDLDNSFKHSFTEVITPYRIGLYDNCIITPYSKHGEKFLNPDNKGDKLDDIICRFNLFYEDFVEKVENYCTC